MLSPFPLHISRDFFVVVSGFWGQGSATIGSLFLFPNNDALFPPDILLPWPLVLRLALGPASLLSSLCWVSVSEVASYLFCIFGYVTAFDWFLCSVDVWATLVLCCGLVLSDSFGGFV